MNSKRKLYEGLSILLGSFILPVMVSILCVIFLSYWSWHNLLLHTAIEALGGFIAWLMAFIILVMRRRNQIEPVYFCTSCALLGMGTLDFLHSCIPPGITFVWLHSTATLVGGIFFAMTWLPQRIVKSRHISSLPVIIPIAVSVFGVCSMLFPQMLPAMVSQGTFTLTAKALNVSGGILFLSAATHFYIKFRKSGNLGDLIFTNHCLLFGMAGLLFELSVLWGAGWWWWHFLRLTAYLLALCYLLVIYRRLEEAVRIANKQLNSEITERRHREKDLEKYGLLFDNITDLAYICDTEGKVLFLSGVFEKLSGHKPEEFIGKSFAPLFDEENLEKAMDLYTRTLKGESLKQEVCFKDTGVLCEYKNIPFRNNKGDIIGVLGSARDITERKRLENELKNINKSLEQRVARRTKEWAKANEALQIKIVQHTKTENLLQKSQEQLQSILDNSPAVIYLKDKNSKYLLINHQYETLFHVNRNEIMGKTDLDIFPENMAEVLQANDRKVLNAGVPLELEEIVPHDDGPHTYISLKFPLFDQNGIPERVCGISTDITERKRTEEVLRNSEEKYNRLIENLKDNYFLYSHNTDGIFTYLSTAITNILGYTTEEFLTHYSEYMTDNPSNDRVIRHTELSIKGIKQPPYEVELYHKDGSIRTLKVQEVPVFDKDHKVIAVEGIAEDITESKRAQEKLVTYQVQLKHISSTLSLAEERERRHISEDLHDRIGQALAVIKMKLGELSDLQLDTDSKHVLNETRELLANAIQDTRTLTFEISPPILYELGFEPAVEWLIEQFRERHNIPIEYKVNGDDKMLDDDVSFFLFKSVRELLFNAIKYSRANRIKVLVRRDKKRIRICIEDDGVGFDFTKVQFSLENLSGFGLFSIRERMEHFGGHLDVKSKSGQGTCITLVMSLKQQKGDRSAK